MGRFLAIAALAAFAGLSAQPLRAQTETMFVQGDETYAARILPGRVAVILSGDTAGDAERNRAIVQTLGGQPLPGMGRNVLALPAPELHDPAALGRKARETAASRPDDIVETGILVTIGASDQPFILTDKIIVQLADHAPPETIRAIAADFGVEIVSDDPFNAREFVVAVAGVEKALGVSNAINGRPDVLFAHPDFYLSVESHQSAVTPNDTFFVDQWHLNNTGQGNGTPDADIDADLAWSFGLGSPDVVIAVIDMGFALDHPDMVGSVWTNPNEIPGNGVDDDLNTFADDVHGWDFTACNILVCGDPDVTAPAGENHGVAVAGAALARGNNGIGVLGSCPGCSFLPIRAIEAGSSTPVSTFGRAIRYATAMGADVISNSWSFRVNSVATANVAQAARDAATAGRGGKGAVVLFAMPHGPGDECSGGTPDIASLPEVIAVGPVTDGDALGPSASGDCIDVLGPSDGGAGYGVTTDPVGGAGFNNSSLLRNCAERPAPPQTNLDYTFCFGESSFSTPVVAGVAGLILSQDDTLTSVEVQRLLQDTADKVSDALGAYATETGYSAPASGPPTHGFGRVNAFEAVRTVANAAAGGRGGVDVFVRDNRLDWGNTEQPSNVTFEPTRGTIPHWQSVDIKVDAPPFAATPPVTSTAFDAFAHENPLSGMLNRVYVRVHNRGTEPVADVRVKLHWAFAGAGLPALPADFWTAFPADSTDVTVWRPLPAQILASPLAYSGASVAGGVGDASAILAFDFNAPPYDATLPDPEHYCLFAVIDADADPVSASSTGSLVPDLITPRDNNVTHRNVALIDSGNGGGMGARMIVANPFGEAIETRLVINAPKSWKTTIGGVERGGHFKLQPGQRLPVDIALAAPEPFAREQIDVLQLYRSGATESETLLGGMTYDIAPRQAPRASATADIVRLLEGHQSLVNRYEQLVSALIGAEAMPAEERALIDRLGRLVEDQGRLLRGVVGSGD